MNLYGMFAGGHRCAGSGQRMRKIARIARIALAWLYDPATGNYRHNGATGGYSAHAFFNPKSDYAAVVW